MSGAVARAAAARHCRMQPKATRQPFSREGSWQTGALLGQTA